jgi:hypothetical protein
MSSSERSASSLRDPKAATPPKAVDPAGPSKPPHATPGG